MPIDDPLLQLPMAGVTAARSDATANRARILEVTRGLLQREGLAATSIDRIAAAAGVGKGTIFRRFGDRAGLMAALLDERMRAFQDAFLSGPPPLGPGAPAAARLESFVEQLLAMLDEDLQIALAAEDAASRGAAGVVAGALVLHVSTLVAEIDPRLDSPLVANLLLGAISPPVIGRLRAAGTDLAAQQAAARALLRGLTHPDLS